MEYRKQDITSLGDYFMRHMEAMTAEDLFDKGEIAAELACRDKQIAELEDQCRLSGKTIEMHCTTIQQMSRRIAKLEADQKLTDELLAALEYAKRFLKPFNDVDMEYIELAIAKARGGDG